MIAKSLTVVALLTLTVAPVWGITRAPVSGAVDPAVTQANVQKTICRLGYTKTARPSKEWSQAVKRRLLVEQRLSGKVEDYELDHLVPLRLGGAPRNSANLWLQPWTEARIKDEEEMKLSYAVCSGRLTLEQAQERIRLKWGRDHERTH